MSTPDVPAVLSGRDVRLVLATSTGGVGRHVRSLATALVDAGARTTVHGPQATEDLFDFSATGATFIPVEIASGIAPRADTAAWRTLRQPLRDAELVHSHGLRAGLVAGLAIGRTRKNAGATSYVVTWHNLVLDDTPLRGLHVPLERVIARAADVTVAVSPDLRERAERLGANDVRLIPVAGPALPAPSRDSAAIRQELGITGPIVLVVGRLHRQKGIDVLLRAARGWAGRDPQPTLVLAGDGPEGGALRSLAAQLDVRAQFLGRRDDVADLLGAADVVVLPSRWEGSPLAAQEALAAARPLVATAVGGVPQLVGEGARLVPPEDEAALSQAITGLLDDPQAAASLAAAARVVAADLPDEGRTVSEVLGVYAGLLGPSART